MNLIPHCHISLLLTSVSIFSAQCFPTGLLPPGSPVTRTLPASQPPPGSPTTVCTGHPHSSRRPSTSRFPDHSLYRSPALFPTPSHLQVPRPQCMSVTRPLPASQPPPGSPTTVCTGLPHFPSRSTNTNTYACTVTHFILLVLVTSSAVCNNVSES